MFAKLLIAFVTIPLVELLILIKIGEWIGFWPTFAMVVVTGIVGASLAKMQGLLVLNRIRLEIAAGRLPTDDLMDGLIILIGGIVLLTPGILTDMFGFAMLIAPLRRIFKKWLQRRFRGMIDSHTRIYVDGFRRGPEKTDDFIIED